MFLVKDVLLLSIQHATQGIAKTVAYLTETPVTTPDCVPDLVARVSVIQAFLLETSPSKSSHRMALQYIRETIEDILTTLETLKIAVEIHQCKWFAHWRTFDSQLYQTKLLFLRKLLDERVHLYTQLVHIDRTTTTQIN